MTTTATRPAQLAAVRIGHGTAVHAGSLAADRNPDGSPRYVALCPAGKGWNGPGNTWKVTTGVPIGDRVTCRNCQRHHADAVGSIHAQQDAAQPDDADGYDDSDGYADGCVLIAGVLYDADGWEAEPIDEEPPQPWQPVANGPFRGVGLAGEWPMYHADRGQRVGRLRRDAAGRWQAHRDGHPADPDTHATRGEALAAVGWLDTVTVDTLATPDRGGLLTTEPFEAKLLMPDGTPVHVIDVTADGGTVVVTGETAGEPSPVAWSATVAALSTEVFDAGGLVPALPVLVCRFAPGTRLALAPPCQTCGAEAGAGCKDDCPADLLTV